MTDARDFSRVRTLTGKEIELDIEPDYKVPTYLPSQTLLFAREEQTNAQEYSIRDPTSHPANAITCQVSRIKERVEEKEGIPPVQQRLIFGGKQMYEFSLLYTLFFVFRWSRAFTDRVRCFTGRTTRQPQTTTSKAARRCTWSLPCVVDARNEGLIDVLCCRLYFQDGRVYCHHHQ